VKSHGSREPLQPALSRKRLRFLVALHQGVEPVELLGGQDTGQTTPPLFGSKLTDLPDPLASVWPSLFREIARVASERGTGARGLRSVIEKVLEGVRFDVEAGVRYVITARTVRGGEAMRQNMTQTAAPLSARLLRRLRVTKPL
jgi:hypothetical protein